MANRRERLEELASVPLFRSSSKRELEKIAKAADEVIIEAGRVLVTQGEIGRECYVIVSGEAAVSRGFVSVLIDRLRAAPEGNVGLRPVRSPLTPREWEVLDLLSSGLTTEEVTDTLVLSSETVRSHVQRAMRKLDVHSRQDAIDAVRKLRGSAATGVSDAYSAVAA